MYTVVYEHVFGDDCANVDEAGCCSSRRCSGQSAQPISLVYQATFDDPLPFEPMFIAVSVA